MSGPLDLKLKKALKRIRKKGAKRTPTQFSRWRGSLTTMPLEASLQHVLLASE
jgi:hypothetical protein